MICLNAFQTTENDFNDVASLHQYKFIIREHILIVFIYDVLCPFGHDVGWTRGGAIAREEK